VQSHVQLRFKLLTHVLAQLHVAAALLRPRSKLAYTAALLQRGGVLAIGECSIELAVPFICQCPSAGSFNCQWHNGTEVAHSD
jgi:hypothetical protein